MKRREEMAKDKMAEAQKAIRERNALLLQKAALAKKVDELKEKMAPFEQAFEETLEKINFDTSGVPSSVSATAYAIAVASPVKETVITTSEPTTANRPPAKA
ncbi:unnamed protein product [Prunus armeniaca]